MSFVVVFANFFKCNFRESMHLKIDVKHCKSLNILMLFSMIFGSLVWMSYEGFLISSLLVIQAPFTDLQSFAKTDYQLIMTNGINAVSGYFSLAPNDSIQGQTCQQRCRVCPFSPKKTWIHGKVEK